MTETRQDDAGRAGVAEGNDEIAALTALFAAEKARLEARIAALEAEREAATRPDAGAPAGGPDPRVAALEADLDAAERRLARRFEELATLGRMLVEQKAGFERLGAELEARAGGAGRDADDLQRRLDAETQRAAVETEARERAEQSLREVEARLRAAEQSAAGMRASTSWRVTAPLRRLGALLGRR